MKRYIFDLEGNGLLDTLSHIYMVVAKELGQENYIIFSDENIENARPLAEFEGFCAEADLMVGHNAIRYDVPAIEKVLGFDMHDHVKIHDSMIMSKLCNFIRPETSRRHSLKMWGEFLGNNKGEYDKGFDEYHPEMLPYCLQDVALTEKVYMHLLGEVKQRCDQKPLFKTALQTEHALSAISAQQVRDGWLFDFDGCQKLIDCLLYTSPSPRDS